MRSHVARPLAGVQLVLQDVFPGGAARAGRTGHATDQGAIGTAGKRAGLNGGGADIRMGPLTEQFAKAVDGTVPQAANRFRRAVTVSEASATSGQHYLHVVIGNPLSHLGTDLIQV